MAKWTAILVFLSMFVPQIMYYGRGMRSTLALFAAWCVFVASSPHFTQVFVRFPSQFIFQFLFMLVLGYTYAFRGGDAAIQVIYGALSAIIAFVITAYYSTFDPATLRQIRWLTVFLLGLALIPSVPVLYSDPGIARPLATPDPVMTVDVDDAVQAHGVSTYSLYTCIGILIPYWFTLFPSRGAIRKALFAVSLAGSGMATLLSTFTMAAAFLAVNSIGFLVAASFQVRSRSRWLVIFAALSLPVVLSVPFALLYEQSEAVQRVYDKVIRLFQGIREHGVIEGEETGRAEMFVATWEVFCESPVTGVGFQSRGDRRVGGHSSLVDHWAIFGFAGYLPWFLLQVQATHIAIANWRSRRRDAPALASAISWTLYWVASIFNPTAFSILPAMFIFTDCHVRRAAQAA